MYTVPDYSKEVSGQNLQHILQLNGIADTQKIVVVNRSDKCFITLGPIYILTGLSS